MKKIASYALGCKVNQYESEAIAELFAEKGYEVVSVDDEADVYIINTCTVTNFGDKKSRQLIRKVKRQNENAIVAVVRVVVVQRAVRIDVADVVRVGRYKPHPKKNAGRYRRGVIPLFCCSAANRSLSCFLHFAVMFFTFITCRVHSAHCSEEISSFSKESSIRKRTVLHSVSAFFCS